jgi:anti-anti-sigma factor
MPNGTDKPVFLVDAYSDPVVVRIEGRACFSNSASLQTFLSQMAAQGKNRIVMDFRNCSSMDSTFLGVLAGEALELHRRSPPGTLVLCRVGRRNLELLRNLGLHRLLMIDGSEAAPAAAGADTPLGDEASRDELACARLVLEAHESLIAADPSNRGKFQDLLAFLRNRLEQAQSTPPARTVQPRNASAA